jgi:hypothetical protein
MPRIYWMKTSDAFPDDSWLESDLTCFDVNRPDRESDSPWHTCIGNVHQEPYGPREGMWLWNMTAALPGPRLPFPRSGWEAERGEAGRRLVEAYEQMLKFYGILQ